MFSFKNTAVRPRPFVFELDDARFRIRALFGPGLRAEIIYYLHTIGSASIQELAKKIGYAYNAVYQEVKCLAQNRFITIEEEGKRKMLAITEKMKCIVAVSK